MVFVSLWKNHEDMHKFTDQVGDEFNRRSGLSGDEWETEVWEESDALGF